MKKFFTLLLIFGVLIIPTTSKAETEVYIYPVATAQSSYQSGEVIKGQFTIHNLLETRQSDVYYEVGMTSGDTFKSSILVEKQKFDPLFLEAKSKRVIPFQYSVPANIEGRAYIVVNAYSADGNLLAFGNAPILIIKNGTTEIKELVFPREAYLVKSNFGMVEFVKDNRFYPEDDIGIEMLFPIMKGETKITGSIIATQVNSKDEFRSDSTTQLLKSNSPTYFDIPVPKLTAPGVYRVDAVFESDTISVPPLSFTYTVLGPSVVFTDVSTSRLSFRKNKEIEIAANYLIPTSYTPQEYETIFKPLKNSIATIKVVNENDKLVFEDTQSIDLTETTQILFRKRSLVAAEHMFAIITVLDQDNKIINTYSTEFPSEENVESWYHTSKIGWMGVIWGIIILLLVIITLAIYQRFQGKVKGRIPMLLLVIFGTVILGFGLSSSVVSASTFEQGTKYQPPFVYSGFLNDIVYSPLPKEVRSYDPGEAFNLYASIGVFGNVSQNADFRAHVQKTLWYQDSYIPPQNLYNTITPLHQQNIYCNYPSSTIRNLLDWFLCNGEINVGYDSSIYTLRQLSSFVRTSGSSKVLIPNSDWLNSGLLNGNEYLPVSKDFEGDVTSILSLISSNIVTQKAHDYSDSVDEYNPPYIPSGYMFRMFSHKYKWEGSSFPSGVGNTFLHFKNFYPSLPFATFSSASTRKSMYNYDLPLINKVKSTLITYNLPGASTVQSFNFDDVDTIDANGYNSAEFDMAIRAILNFLYALSKSLHELTNNFSSNIATQQSYNSGLYAFVPRFFDIEKYNTFKAPTTPGIYKIYYYAFLNQTAQSWEHTWYNENKDALISQTICVRGGGFCPDEDPDLCPNLQVEGGPVYTQDEGGVIYRDGVATNLEEDESGNCQDPLMCNPDVDYEEISCVDGLEIVKSCSGDGTWTITDTNNSCEICDPNTYGTPISCENGIEFTTMCNSDGTYTITPTGDECFTTSCTSNPLTVPINTDTTFTATSSKPADFEWLSDSNQSLENSQTLIKQYASPGSYTVTINAEATETGQTATNSCSVTVTGCPNYGQRICQNGYYYDYVCPSGVQSLNATGLLCPPTTRDPAVTVHSFDLNPKVVSIESGLCKLDLDVEGAQECRLIKNGTFFKTYTGTTSSIMNNSDNLSIGTYSLECAVPVASGPLDFSGPYGSQKCILNPSVKEN